MRCSACASPHALRVTDRLQLPQLCQTVAAMAMASAPLLLLRRVALLEDTLARHGVAVPPACVPFHFQMTT